MTNVSVRNALEAGNSVMQYDENAKNLLGEKIILAWIIKNVVTEAAEMSIQEIEKNIGDDILISKVRMEPGLSNQKEQNPGYPLVTRGIFYAARMISAQLETEFVASNYQNIKKVYSIWICMNAPDYIGNAITRYNFVKTDVIGETPDHVLNYDKMNVSMIYLNQTKNQEDSSIFHFLNTLLSASYDVDEKIRLLEEKFEIGVEKSRVWKRS